MRQSVPESAVSGSPMVGKSNAHVQMLRRLQQIAASEAPALIEGETGSGKELAARAIHYGGSRRAEPFVPINCGALPDTLIESELFGHERGAFTDARTSRRGLVAEAEGGTLFLDEVDALTQKAQVSLLRFLQDQRYRPVGSTRELTANVRLIAAANRPLEGLVARDLFRADLMYRLKILHLQLPALREREGDCQLLAAHFIDCFAAKYRVPTKVLHPETLAWLERYQWPGNVRELENWVHREFLMSNGPSIELGDGHGAAPRETGSHSASWPPQFQIAKAEAIRLFESDYVQRLLRLADGNVTRAANLAGTDRRAFGKMMKKHGVGRNSAIGGSNASA